MLIGYVRVSKSDGTQTLAPQRDAMLAAGVDPIEGESYRLKEAQERAEQRSQQRRQRRGVKP